MKWPTWIVQNVTPVLWKITKLIRSNKLNKKDPSVTVATNMLRKLQISLGFVKIVSAKIVTTTKKHRIKHFALHVSKEMKERKKPRKRKMPNLRVNLIVGDKEPTQMLCTVAIT